MSCCLIGACLCLGLARNDITEIYILGLRWLSGLSLLLSFRNLLGKEVFVEVFGKGEFADGLAIAEWVLVLLLLAQFN